MKRRLYVQLGRAGDILNILPLLEWEANRTGFRTPIMVAADFAGLLDGVSYAEPIIFPGKFEEIAPALREAYAIAIAGGLDVVCTQIYGVGLYGLETCTSFLRESWARVPDAPAWGTRPLRFDQRDHSRENAVKAQLLRGWSGEYVVCALSGTSSPFEHGPMLRKLLREYFEPRAVKVVDVSGFIAPRLYDLLGLLEGARALVAIDSGVLHLAAAVPSLQVCAFITREPSRWHGSAWRPQQRRFYYDEAPECLPEAVASIAYRVQPKRKLVHVWTQPDHPTGETLRRITLARQTWDEEDEATGGMWLRARYTPGLFNSGRDPIGDPIPMPYIRDLIEHGLREARPVSDVIVVSNADVCFTPGITGLIIDAVRSRGACYAHRWDFARLDRPLRSEAQVKRGRWYAGSDLFAFSRAWWGQNGAELPDMIVGREHVDEVFRQLVKRTGGAEIPAAIYHEKHESYWERPDVRSTNPGNRHNRRLARKWYLRTGYGPNDHEWWRPPGF